MEGYVLAKTGDKYLVMPEEFYFKKFDEELLKKFAEESSGKISRKTDKAAEAANHNLSKLLLCSCNNEAIKKQMCRLGTCDYRVEVNRATSEIMSMDESYNKDNKSLKRIYIVGLATGENLLLVHKDKEYNHPCNVTRCNDKLVEGALYLYVVNQQNECYKSPEMCIGTPLMLEEKYGLRYCHGWKAISGKQLPNKVPEHDRSETSVMDENGKEYHFGFWMHKKNPIYGNVDEEDVINSFSFDLSKLCGELKEEWNRVLDNTITANNIFIGEQLVAYTEKNGEVEEVYAAQKFADRIPWVSASVPLMEMLYIHQNEFIKAKQEHMRLQMKPEGKELKNYIYTQRNSDFNPIANQWTVLTSEREEGLAWPYDTEDYDDESVRRKFWIKPVHFPCPEADTSLRGGVLDVKPMFDYIDKLEENVIVAKDKQNAEWFLKRTKKVLQKNPDARAVVQYQISQEDSQSLIPVLVWMEYDVFSWKKRWYLTLWEDEKCDKKKNLIMKYNRCLDLFRCGKISEAKWEEIAAARWRETERLEYQWREKSERESEKLLSAARGGWRESFENLWRKILKRRGIELSKSSWRKSAKTCWREWEEIRRESASDSGWENRVLEVWKRETLRVWANEMRAEACRQVLSEAKWEELYFMSLTLTDYFAEELNGYYTCILKNLFKICLDKMENLTDVGWNEERLGEYSYDRIADYKSLRQWADEVTEELLNTEGVSEKQKEWWLRLLLRLPNYYAMDLIEAMEEKFQENHYMEKLGVSKQELDLLRSYADKYEKIIQDTNFRSMFMRLQQLMENAAENGMDFENILYGSEVKKKWGAVKTLIYNQQEKSLKQQLSDSERIEIANMIAELKENPNKILAELVVKSPADERGSLSVPPAFRVEVKERALYSKQKRIRIAVSCMHPGERCLEAMPAKINKVELILSWDEKHKKTGYNQQKEKSIVIKEQFELLPGGSKLLEFPLGECLENKNIVSDKIRYEIKIFYSGNYYGKEKDYPNAESVYCSRRVLYDEIPFFREFYRKVNTRYLDTAVCKDSLTFVGREDELKKIATWIKNDTKHLYVFGHRQCGKSSLFAQITDGNTYRLTDRMKELVIYEEGEPKEEVIVLSFSNIGKLLDNQKLNPDDVDLMKNHMHSAIVAKLKMYIERYFEQELSTDEDLEKLYYGERKFFDEADVAIVSKALSEKVQNLSEESSDKSMLQSLLKVLQETKTLELRSTSTKKNFGKISMDAIYFDEWMNLFEKVVENKYGMSCKIVLILDEFTTLCKLMLEDEKYEEHKEQDEELLRYVLEQSFNRSNIKVLAAGHESINLQVEKVVNDTTLTDKNAMLGLSELKREDANELIFKAFDEWKEGIFTKEAVERIYQLSGGNAKVLKSILSNHLLENFEKGYYGECITELDVERCAKEQLNNKALFDPFLVENTKEEEINAWVFDYLKEVSTKLNSAGRCIAEKMENNKEIQSGLHKGRTIQEILLGRDVINVDQKNNVSIKVELLQNYLLQEDLQK